jgi:hypothetical protein
MWADAMTEGVNVEPQGGRINSVLPNPSLEHLLQQLLVTSQHQQSESVHSPDHDIAVLLNRSLVLWEQIMSSCLESQGGGGIEGCTALPNEHVVTVRELRVVRTGHGVERPTER